MWRLIALGLAAFVPTLPATSVVLFLAVDGELPSAYRLPPRVSVPSPLRRGGAARARRRGGHVVGTA